jgi:acyl-CoA synthetase (AMP-forming)/AMP-acid ligase II
LVENFTVTDLVNGFAAAKPNEAAVIYDPHVITYAALSDMGKRAAQGLQDLGVGPGDRVAFWLPNCPAYLALFLGCCRLGAIAVAVNTRYRSGEVSDIMGRSGAKILAMWPGFRHIDFLGLLEDVDSVALDRLETLILYNEGEQASLPPTSVQHCRVVNADDVLAHLRKTWRVQKPEATSSPRQAPPARQNSCFMARVELHATPVRSRIISAIRNSMARCCKCCPCVAFLVLSR